MINTKNVLLLTFLTLASSMFCNYYPMDPQACISKTDGVQCIFSQFENACLSATLTSYGCVPTLNKEACLNQLTNGDNTEATCKNDKYLGIFRNKCGVAKKQHFKHLGCSDLYSKYSCMNVIGADCTWNDTCGTFTGVIPSSNTCGSVFLSSVTPSLCQQIQNIACMNGEFQNDYQCIDVTEKMLTQLLCTQSGLNQQGCISIINPGQACIFENNQCKNVTGTYPSQCGLALNRLGCLQISKPQLQCQWKNGQCQNFVLGTQECGSITEVNSSVCSNYQGVCRYDSTNMKCQSPSTTELKTLTCNTFGLTQATCLQIKNYNCTFYRGVCEELSTADLSLFQCDMLLNQSACVNILTEFQYCKWDGTSCSRMFINQDVNCPVEKSETSTFNGKVCQNISKSGIACKYNSTTHKCVISASTDYCDSPYLNLQGCISIARPGTACNWTLNGCEYATIIQNQTKCSSLGYANAIACSQVYENQNMGCYFDSILQQCQSIVISESAVFLDKVLCSDLSLGLNKITCASITTPGQICRWYQNQCVQIKKKEAIASAECISLQFVNKYVCGLVEYGKEPCRYLSDQLGCVNSLINPMPCSQAGLNSYACAIATGSCYFDTVDNQCKSSNYSSSNVTTESAALVSSIECDSSSPTIDICIAIVTENQLCGWSYRTNRCTDQYVPFNSQCLDFSGTNISINANVCAAVLNEFPDYDWTVDQYTNQNRGYCKFNADSGNCEVSTDECTTTCCTEDAMIGINAHVCSKNSSEKYCYFGNNLRCTELTTDTIDIDKIEALSAFYNSNQFTCSQMNKNSCYMIEWSTKQRCYSDGVNACVNVNFANYKFNSDLSETTGLIIFTKSPAILNKYACLGIEGSSPDKKYFGYDDGTHLCTLLTPTDAAEGSSCEDVKGNRNVCLTFTSKLQCKWDPILLTCNTLSDQESSEMTSCNQNQNIKVCIENPNTACVYSTDSDRCIDALLNQPCTYFDSLGKVSESVCQKIVTPKEMCRWDSYKCKSLDADNDQISSGCDVNKANAIACYKLTNSECRWDSINYKCYENQSLISTLGCSDNLNKVLCLKVTKEPCYWNDDQYLCLKFTANLKTFLTYKSTFSYNEMACASITGDAYYFYLNTADLTDSDNYKCKQLNGAILSSCDSTSITNAQSMNQQACLLNTMSNPIIKCFYDPSEISPKNRCKPFTDDITSCTSTVQINIGVCMQIPKQCYFNVSTLTCISTNIAQNKTCSYLNDQSKGSAQKYYNFMACAAISTTLTQSDGTQQCLGRTQSAQTCNYEKYCFWDISVYTCNIKILQNLKWDPDHQKDGKQCSSDQSTCTENSDCAASGNRRILDDSSTTDPPPPAPTCVNVKLPDPKCNNDDVPTPILYLSDCSITYSKALCLEMNTVSCYFDLNQGGCRPITGNEWKLPNCSSIYNTYSDIKCTSQINSCTNSSTKNAICKANSPVSTQPIGCTSLARSVAPCGTNQIQIFKSSYKCKDVKTFASPATCAGASDECFYDSKVNVCLNETNCEISCNPSFSQKICESCGCNYTFLGYCQPKQQDNPNPIGPQLNSDNSNLYFLCNEVNLLNTSDKSKPCGSVAQSCIYSGSQCIDATGYTCSSLIGQIVTQRACTRCLEKSVIYDLNKYSCTLVTTSQGSCNNLNRMACLLQTNINCRWINYTCTQFTLPLSSSDSKDCSIYNKNSCNEIFDCWRIQKKNICNELPNCWIHPTTKYCTIFDPTLGSCSDYLIKSICNLSNKESCYWDNDNGKCKSTSNLTDFTCEIANKYGCLNNNIKLCGWSQNLNQCKTITADEQASCSKFLSPDYNEDQLSNFNAKVCSSINDVDNSCLRDSNYKCREQISSDIITCSTPGLNKYACINSTTDKCKFENFSCVSETSTNIGCSDILNINACFAQSATCKFDEYHCQSFENISVVEDILDIQSFSYSVSVCSFLDIKDKLPNYKIEPLVYSQVTRRCVSVAKRSPYISTCSLAGMNISACLQKTTVFCRFQNNNCDVVDRTTLNSMKTCEQTLNWYACTSLSIQCKFVEGKCQAIKNDDTCSNLQSTSALVNANVCSSRTDTSCKLNTLTNQCEVVTTQQLCNTSGLNLKGCQFSTKGSMCVFSNGNGTCLANYSDVNCTDTNYKLNEDKCYSITTAGQYCFFDNENGCQNIGIDQQYLYKDCAVPDVKTIKQTNPITCSQSSEACFYDKKSTKQCIKYEQPNPDNVSSNYDWSNSISFSKKACQMYAQNSLKVYWDGKKCVKITANQLQFFNCKDPVNLYGCVSITTPGQFCIFQDNECTQADLTLDAYKNCLSNFNVNSSAFCELATDIQCKYSSSSFSCIKVEKDLKCLSASVISEGYNQLACTDTTCIFNQHCYKIDSSTYNFCNDTGVSLSNCNTVANEGCMKDNQGNTCIAILDYSKIECSQALNKYGCVRITNLGHYCKYESNKCVSATPSGSSDMTCDETININSYVFCEKFTSSGCKYDPLNRKCASVVSTDQFSCMRGLNAIACLNNTTASLKCLFLNYCYGPNSDILNCSTNAGSCCPLAVTIESCLYQSQFSCNWNNNSCQSQDIPISKCQGSQNVSINVCISINSEICVFDSSTLTCKSITPTSCDQVQSIDQCKMINDIPCYWNSTYSQCQFKIKQPYDQCDDIQKIYGNQRSCMDVERAGQMCLYQNNQCTTFKEQQNTNNCFNNINKVACTNQVQSECIWNIQTIQIMQTSSDISTTAMDQGICQLFNDYDSTICSDVLSYLSCLQITKKGAFCIWHDEKCQQIQISKSTIYSSQQLVLINSNACGLINDGNKVIYNNKTYTCDIITDQSLLTCSPYIPGTNKAACLSIKTQKCQWNDTYKYCEHKENRLLIEQKITNLRLLEAISCKLDGLGSRLCAQISLSMPCGSVQNGCDQIDLNNANCDDQGLNKYSCLNLTTGPCVWLQNDDDEFYHCESYTPYVSCSNILQNVNAIVCSYVQDDACIYNQITSSCQIPNQIYNQCNILGINAIACSQINGCVFQNQQCIQLNENINLLCNSIPQANYQVCQQAIDRCKYSDLTYGCVTSTITDNCNTQGISALGCNVLDGCKWDNNQCQCLAYLKKYPNCSSITTYLDCINLDYCYFEISKTQSNKDITQYLKNTNFGVCRDKTCNDFEIINCQGNKINGNLCYLNNQSECKMASKCEEINNPSIDCTQYFFNKKPCTFNKLLNYCVQLDCNLLDQQQCQQFTNYCVYIGYCKNRTCEYMGQNQCLQNNCDWNDFTQKCSIQQNCSQIQTSDQCLQKKQLQIQCAWIVTLDGIEQCTDNGCRYLGITQGECMGTHIGTDVCVQMSDFSCVSCEEITDSCLCLQQSQYCSFNKQTQKCYSYSCQQHNQSDCPISHCKFNNKDKVFKFNLQQICQPMCQYNYNQEQCNASDDCAWDTINKICTPYIVEPAVIQINLPNPNYSWLIQSILLGLIQILA